MYCNACGQAMAEDDHAFAGRTVVTRGERASIERLDTHHFESVGGDARTHEALGFTHAGQVDPPVGICGETVEGFTYEKFEQTLRRNREALVKRHAARHVKFTVYVRDGKAALKANPIKE